MRSHEDLENTLKEKGKYEFLKASIEIGGNLYRQPGFKATRDYTPELHFTDPEKLTFAYYFTPIHDYCGGLILSEMKARNADAGWAGINREQCIKYTKKYVPLIKDDLLTCFRHIYTQNYGQVFYFATEKQSNWAFVETVLKLFKFEKQYTQKNPNSGNICDVWVMNVVDFIENYADEMQEEIDEYEDSRAEEKVTIMEEPKIEPVVEKPVPTYTNNTMTNIPSSSTRSEESPYTGEGIYTQINASSQTYRAPALIESYRYEYVPRDRFGNPIVAPKKTVPSDIQPLKKKKLLKKKTPAVPVVKKTSWW